MAKTLTISVEDEHAARAEQLAASNGMSVTEWVERLVRAAATPVPLAPASLPPITRSALGLLKGVPDRPYKELVADALLEKYGLPK